MLFLLFLFLSPITSFNNSSELILNEPKLPVVLMHGILSNKEKMNELKSYLEINFDLNVVVPEIGNGSPNSLNLPLSDQGEILCFELNNNTMLEHGFNFIGISQGGILARYYIEVCGNYRVNNFITLVSPHGGVYNNAGLIIDMYGKFAQEHYSFSSYWRDPYDYMRYTEVALLARLNNEVETECSSMYKERFTNLSNFVMVYSTVDEILKPPESGKFSTYSIDSLDVVSVEYTSTYNNLGLNEMADRNQLHVYETNCIHSEHIEYNCIKQLHDMFKEFCS
jgi:palmitoyl-protein thioesterase